MSAYAIYVYFACLNILVFSFGAGHYNQSLRTIKNLKMLLRHPQAKHVKIENKIDKMNVAIRTRQHVIFDVFIAVLVVQLMVAKIFALFDVNGIAPTVMFLIFIALLFLFYSLKGGRVMPNRTNSASNFRPF